MRIIRTIFFALSFAGAMVGGSASEGWAQQQLAQAKTCSGFQAMCAARCKTRAPQDPTCVEDHCTPKLMTCRQDGCWQEGRLYGGKKTCGLGKA